MERIKNFFNDESGASAVEYGLLVSSDRGGDHHGGFPGRDKSQDYP